MTVVTITMIMRMVMRITLDGQTTVPDSDCRFGCPDSRFGCPASLWPWTIEQIRLWIQLGGAAHMKEPLCLCASTYNFGMRAQMLTSKGYVHLRNHSYVHLREHSYMHLREHSYLRDHSYP
jgi:hypothetical protein